jgi:hypothetical protein
MVLSYMHILKKIFLKNYITSESDGWMLGGYAFFMVSLHYCPGYITKCNPPQRLNPNYNSEYFLVFI